MPPYDPDKHHRRSIRLKGYDYSQPGAYFITIATQNRECLLEAPAVQQMVYQWWGKLPSKFPGAQIDTFAVMPNHIHGIVVFVGADPRVRPLRVGPESARGQGPTHGSAPTGGPTGSRADLRVRPAPMGIKGRHTGRPLQWGRLCNGSRQ